jgi:hypothetical protein
MSISAMKQALEALERGRSQIIGALVQQDQDEAITALRQAIAEAEEQDADQWYENLLWGKPKPVAWIVDGEIKVRLDMAGKLYYSETNVYEKDVVDQAIQQEPVAFVSGYTNGECVVMPMNPAVVFSVGTALYNAPVHASDISQECVDETAKDRHEPVAWMSPSCKLYPTRLRAVENGEQMVTPLYAAPPKREWVGLTDEEGEDLLKGSKNAYDAIKRIEAKLKEKNT